MWRVLAAVTRLASVEQLRPRLEDENDRLLCRKPAHAAERQLEAVPDEPEEQHVDVLQVFPRSVSRSPCRMFVSVVDVSVTTSSFTTASTCRTFVWIVTVTVSCLTMSCFFAASRDARWESAGSAPFNFFHSTNDIFEACVNFHHWDNEERCGRRWLS